SGKVQPSSCPALAIMRRGQQLIDQAVVGVWTGILNEFIGFFGSRRKADQIEINAAAERVPVRLWRWLQPFLFLPREHEIVDRVAWPALLLDSGQGGTLRGNKRPVGFIDGSGGNPPA